MRVQSNISCEAALELMSPFIDSMVAVEESESLRSHLSECTSCRRQLQSFVSLRNVFASVEPVPVPEDLQLETRVKLSHERLYNIRDRWQARFDNILKPFAMPAVMGIVLTLLGFGILLGRFDFTRWSDIGRRSGCLCGGHLSAAQHTRTDVAASWRKRQ